MSLGRTHPRGSTYTILILDQTLVITADGDEEEQAVDVLETMYPLLPLRSLAADIEHPVRKLAQVENRLGDTGCPQSRSQQVLVVGDVALGP